MCYRRWIIGISWVRRRRWLRVQVLPLAAKELLMDKTQLDASPIADLQVSVSPTAEAARPEVCALLDRFGIVVVLNAAYEWGGYRYSNASDAIAAARRAEL